MKKLKIKEVFLKDKKIIDQVREECEKYNINIYECCREAKVPIATVTNWKNEPGAFSTLKALYQAIETLKKNK